MPDPLSITGLVLQVGALVKQLYDYGKQVKDARKDINALCGDLLALKGLLEDLKDHQPGPDDKDSLIAILSRAQFVLSDLLQRLEPGLTWHRRARQSLTWPFDKAHIDEILTNLERIKTALLLALMGDYHSALADISHIKDDITSIKGDLREVRNLAVNEAASQKQQRQDEALEKLYNRIAPVSPATTHKKVCAVWQGSESGSWFIDGHLKPWLNDDSSRSQLMALCGVSGAGKSTIISRVIEDLGTNVQVTPVVYFYCTYNELATHEVRHVLGSWLVQLSRIAESQELSKFERYVGDDNEIPIESLQEAIARMTETIGPVLLVLDALNESTKSEKILASIMSLFKLSKKIRCLISTTLHVGSALERLETPYIRVTMSPGSIEDDVIDYIKREVKAHEILRAVGEDNILSVIVPHTQGMFRWASCQMSILCEYVTVKMVRRALKNLPGSLDEIYIILLQRVPPAFKDLVREALIWLTYSIRPLSLHELIEAIVIEVGEESIDDTCRIHPPHRILDLCQGLMVWNEDSEEVSLAHSSVATFLESDRIRSSPVAHFALNRGDAAPSMIQKLLSYISMDEFCTGLCSSRTHVQRYLTFPLLDYASTMWALHAFDVARIHGQLGEAEARMALKFFRTYQDLPNGGNFVFWVQCLVPDTHDSVIMKATPLYYAASFGLTPLVKMMFDLEQIDIEDQSSPWYIDKLSGRGWSSPLMVASYRGHIDVVRILLEHGARPNLRNGTGNSARTLARTRGHRAVARLIRDYGGVEKDDFDFYGQRDETYSINDQDDISGDDEVPNHSGIPYHGVFRSKRFTSLNDQLRSQP